MSSLLVYDIETGENVSRREWHNRLAARVTARAASRVPETPTVIHPTEPEAPPPRDPEPKQRNALPRRLMGIAETEARDRRREMNALDNHRILNTLPATDEEAVRARELQENPPRLRQPVFNDR